MSKKFKRQDYFRYKRLGKKWRRPVGWQSKLRLRKGGAGLKVSIGYGTPGKMMPTFVRNEKDLEKDCRFGIIISSSLGSKKTMVIAEKAKQRGIAVLNMKKVKRAKRLAKSLKKETKPKKEAAPNAAAKAENKNEHAGTHAHADGTVHSHDKGE